MQRAVQRVNQKLAKHESVRSFHVLISPFTTEDALLTPSLKVRRNRVFAHYADEIQSLYHQGKGQTTSKRRRAS